MLDQALHAADELILEHETLTLNEADWEVFPDALENPPKPSAKLKQAFAEHKKRVQRYLRRGQGYGDVAGAGRPGKD